MPESGSPPLDSTGHSRRRLLFVVCSLVAVIVCGVLLASFSSGNLAGSPIDSVLPGEDVSAEQAQGGQPLDGTNASSGALGSLTPGSQTGTGGEIGLDNGTFASTDTQVHFVAESSQPTYWRTAAYGTYTGSGWERTTETEPYDAPLTEEGFDRLEYNVTLSRPATALPTPWQPVAVGGIDEDSLGVGANGGVQSTGTLSTGTTFSGVSRAPASGTALLRSVDDTTPPELDRYTQLPESTAPRLGTLTGNIAADADGRYETAVAVQNWLREDKTYSLEAYRESGSIAETFVFDMEAGYCEYFATAMAAMLRTQDIPTRYAVGYSSGQRADNNTYRVRGMNAHAWVEVYFADIGWVQFDPTPGGARLQTQAQALEDIGEDYNVTDPGSPGETFDLDEQDEDENDTTTSLSVELNRTAVPGVTVEATVTAGGVPVEGLDVEFSGTPVGVTDRDGTVTGRVPEAEEFDIAVFDSRDVPPEAVSASLPENLTLARGGTALPNGFAAGAVTAVQDPDRPNNDTDTPVYNETIEVTTEATIEIQGQTVPGNEVGVSVSVGADVLTTAAVRVDGERRGLTDSAGWVTVVLPSSPGSTTITAERGPVTGERTVDLPPLEVDTQVEWPLAVPFAPATVEATYGDDPAVGVPVEINNETVATTGVDGKAAVRLPVSQRADITVTRYGVSAGTTIGGVLVTLLLVVGSAVALFGGGFLLTRHLSASESRVAGLFGALGGRLRGLGGLTTRLLVVGAGRGDTLLGAVSERLGGTLGLVLAALGLREQTGDTDSGDWPGREDGPVAVDAGDGPLTDEQATVRAAWARFLAHVSAPATTNTPGELATHAIEHDGLPAEPVRTLRDAFRAVEYGSRPAEPNRVQAAVEAIETATDTPGEGHSGGGD